MAAVSLGLGSLTPELIEELAKDGSQTAKVFCINGVIVEIPLRAALERIPYAVMHMQPLMKTVIEAQGRQADFLCPDISSMLLADIPEGREIENINKDSVNMVSVALGGKEVFGPDDRGVLE